ncbi:NAD(P)H-hydrate dehydratase [Pacificimonas flava]|uniref:ADP-dependent (S)-NAD(P)H-hydrate dehydratase n=2 Tax=Pacificimonas TaxID=1960290 RepID=A0A219B8I8_9SPHN|nr:MULTISPECIES: NAD(P)H-hydrate dehydratase [Pacificimonas]MBZ6378605.1 NAD(P)H-hydrate dehydratase [Pacificimonas aurantium]OWV34119.1 NAD(P)H-hydrate dehydratase [Pacificimonas flava]
MTAGAILTASEMKGFEQDGAPGDEGGWSLMCRAGQAAADRIAIRAAGREILILCGPGNNGGDGYVAAARLRDLGLRVRVAALIEPESELCRRARDLWVSEVESPEVGARAGIFVDAVFGSGQDRPLSDKIVAAIGRLANAAELRIALDLVSGSGCDDGADLGAPYHAEETLVFAAWKPAHALYPAAGFMGHLDMIDIGLGEPKAELRFNSPPEAIPSPATSHKFDRGTVLVAAGHMPGAAWLAARAAQRGGAGYVTLAGYTDAFPPSSVVQMAAGEIDADRQDAAVIGPGLGRGEESRALAQRIIDIGCPLVLDGDILSWMKPDDVPPASVLTPHEGEFRRMFGNLPGSKVERARTAASRCGAVVCLKGRDTVIASPEGAAVVNDHAHPRLGTAGSGDVLAGLVGAELARGRAPFEAACAGVWRHGDAGCRGRDGLIAEDLLDLIR